MRPTWLLTITLALLCLACEAEEPDSLHTSSPSAVGSRLDEDGPQSQRALLTDDGAEATAVLIADSKGKPGKKISRPAGERPLPAFSGRTLSGTRLKISSLIEATRFPIQEHDESTSTRGYQGLTRAADFIGQLGDPDYMRKIPALYHELQDSGLIHVAGYSSPQDMRTSYASFYWGSIRPHIGDALIYLQQTLEGRRWIAGLHKHVFDVEHGQ